MLSTHGHSVYQLFDTVVVLDQVLRQSGMDPATQIFRQLLLRLRDGSTTQEDWQMLLTRDPSIADDSGNFSDAVHLYYDKASVIQYNYSPLETQLPESMLFMLLQQLHLQMLMMLVGYML